ncbi:MAG: hypothetical protein AAFQ62_05395 [Pseudomonadota bacterium]
MEPSRQHPDSRLAFLWFCEGCRRYHDEEMFEKPGDPLCLSQLRRQERIAEGLVEDTKHRTRTGKAVPRPATGKAPAVALEAYKKRLLAELKAEGVPEWEVWARAQPALEAKRVELASGRP